MHAKFKIVKLKSYKMSKGLLLRENELWVPDNKSFKLRAIKKIHDQLAVNYSDREKMLNITRCHYYWPCMRQTIEQYI